MFLNDKCAKIIIQGDINGKKLYSFSWETFEISIGKFHCMQIFLTFFDTKGILDLSPFDFSLLGTLCHSCLFLYFAQITSIQIAPFLDSLT